MSEEEFLEKVGRLPVDDELERVNCEYIGTRGHSSCGWCKEHDKPRAQCGCLVKLVTMRVGDE